MARTNNLTNYLTDVAQAIKDKKGDQTPIQASEFDTEIANLPSGGETYFTGHYDAEGLTTIGWTAEEIKYYQDNGVQWVSADDDDFKLNASELAGDESNTTRYLPKSSTITNFYNYQRLIAIPLVNTTGQTSFYQMFYNCKPLAAVPLIDTSSALNLKEMFYLASCIKTIPLLNTSKVTNFNNMFGNCYSLEYIPDIDLSKGTDFSNMFNNCRNLLKAPRMNTENATNLYAMFNNCSSLRAVPEIDANKVVRLNSIFDNCACLTAFGGFKNIGQSYQTTASENYTYYTITLFGCPGLTHDSLMNVINKLYDIGSIGVQPQKVELGSINYAKLTAEEIAIGTAKGWNIVAS